MIELIVKPANEAARAVAPDGVTRIFPDEMRLKAVDYLVREWFMAEGMFGNGEEYDIFARIPANHPDAKGDQFYVR